jgi:hypothetical protein
MFFIAYLYLHIIILGLYRFGYLYLPVRYSILSAYVFYLALPYAVPIVFVCASISILPSYSMQLSRTRYAVLVLVLASAMFLSSLLLLFYSQTAPYHTPAMFLFPNSHSFIFPACYILHRLCYPILYPRGILFFCIGPHHIAHYCSSWFC